jgi:hypothetical protein
VKTFFLALWSKFFEKEVFYRFFLGKNSEDLFFLCSSVKKIEKEVFYRQLYEKQLFYRQICHISLRFCHIVLRFCHIVLRFWDGPKSKSVGFGHIVLIDANHTITHLISELRPRNKVQTNIFKLIFLK